MEEQQTTTIKQSVNTTLPNVDPEIEEMAKAGIHLGHSKSKTHPTMRKYIFGIRNNITLIDLSATKRGLESALEFIKEIAKKNGVIFFVGTKPAGRKAILELVERINVPYFVERWIGGTLTNFKVITERVKYMENLEKEKESGGFEKYAKKERLKKDEEIERLRRRFNGLRTLKKLPDALFVVDVNKDITAVREARQMKIPVIALCDTNSNADIIDYPIPASDDALPAVRYILKKVADAFASAKADGIDANKDEKEAITS